MNISVDDPKRDDDIIREKFMKELCRRDDEVNRNRDVNINPNHNEFRIADIRRDVLDTYELDRVIDFLQRFEVDSSGDPFIELGGRDRRETVRLTDPGRVHCGEFGL